MRLDAAYRPASSEAKIGGDWYDAFVLDDGRLAITVGDVLGHGLQAAVLMTKLRLAMQSAAMVNASPQLMLRVADSALGVADADAYATAAAAVYDPATRALTIASAGHPNPLLRTADGRVEELAAAGCMLGVRGGAPAERTVTLDAGSAVMFYTDGLIEFDRDLGAGFARVAAAFADPALLLAHRPAEALVSAVLRENDARDDVAVLIAQLS
jgi:serine phosphatase RsbU (regulator of sigma subunit)